MRIPRRPSTHATPQPDATRRFFTLPRLGVALAAACLLAVFVYVTSAMRENPEDAFCSPEARLAMVSPDGLFEPDAACGPEEVVHEGTVSPGDTMAGILGKYIPASDIRQMSQESREFRFSSIQAGQPYSIATTKDGEFISFTYVISSSERLVIRAERDEYHVDIEAEPHQFRAETAYGAIEENLFAAVKKAGEDPELAVNLADIFAWDIDFCKDLRRGDTFKVVVEKRYAGENFVGYGRILAAEFTNQGKTSRAFLFDEKTARGGYFDEKGQAMKKAFLRAPLSFRRITSGFSKSRLHPILHVRKPHLGVDYAAAAGTPVWSVGNGVVIEKGYNHAAGNYVTVKHNQTYTTRYNHFSRFAKGVAKGKTVRQGEVIGYVGATGYATGPHLDFRMYRSGQAINVLENPKITADPVPAAKMAAFKAKVEPLLAMLQEAGKPRSVAQANPGPGHDPFAPPSAPDPVELFTPHLPPEPPTASVIPLPSPRALPAG